MNNPIKLQKFPSLIGNHSPFFSTYLHKSPNLKKWEWDEVVEINFSKWVTSIYISTVYGITMTQSQNTELEGTSRGHLVCHSAPRLDQLYWNHSWQMFVQPDLIKFPVLENPLLPSAIYKNIVKNCSYYSR